MDHGVCNNRRLIEDSNFEIGDFWPYEALAEDAVVTLSLFHFSHNNDGQADSGWGTRTHASGASILPITTGTGGAE